ncbi:MAG: CBS domain-containing protein [Verrucomicrobiales bacterium]|nr:CBS domain-containing protein [Verrucomicrobiales bacterium]
METYLTELLQHKGGAVFAVTPHTKVKAAAVKMRKNKIGALLIMEGRELLGIFTERDILTKIVAKGLDAADVEVQSIMTRKVIVIDPGRTVREAMQVITEQKLRHLPVVQDGKLIGMLSGGDLTRAIVAEAEGFIGTLYEYIQGGYPA